MPQRLTARILAAIRYALLPLLVAPLVVLGLTAQPASAASGSDTLWANETLYPGGYLVSHSGAYRLVLQTDGNLVVYGSGGATWSSNTAGSGTTRAVMQGDGNLVAYDGGGRAVFATGTNSSGANALVMQDDGNLVEYAPGRAVWASKNSSERAIQWFYDHRGSTAYEGKCELAVENAFGISGKYATARADWNARSQQQPYSAAPRGALVFYNTSTSGHVAMSLGNGQVISTSAGGRIGIVSISYFQNPLGWAWAPW
jgi:hypothetical protein